MWLLNDIFTNFAQDNSTIFIMNKMTIHIFNPEHDIALASNLEHFTAPHAGRELRNDLGVLPALWAKPDEYVLVDDKSSAECSLRHWGLPEIDAKLIDTTDIKNLLRQKSDDNDAFSRLKIMPWGWDTALRHELIATGLPVESLPTNAWLNALRIMSHRAWASTNILSKLRHIEGTVGESCELKTINEVRQYLSKHHSIVLKAPWSSSGRGIRYISDIKGMSQDGRRNASTYYGLTTQLEGWIRNVINRQGSVMAEPYYNKVCDFGMEFISHGRGEVVYRGLSIFQTSNGAYTGNLLDDETHKEMQLCRFLSQNLLRMVASRIVELTSQTLAKTYHGPFGIDMMVVRVGEKLMLHPCVEMNLRMTMGHVAILLSEKYHLEDKAMRIIYADGKYKLRIEA